MTQKLFVTTALPYANAAFHIGHMMEYIQADIWVRFQRMRGAQVNFVCADDAHGAPIMLKAEAEGISPQELVARITADRPRYLQGFHIGFDHWYSTDSPENVALSQDIYRRLKAAGLVYVKAVEQFYDPVKAMFLADRYIKGECPNCHSKEQFADACEVCSIVNSPADLIASTANNLKTDGWNPGQPWGYEVALPAGFDFMLADSSKSMTMKDWNARGVVRVGGKPFPRPADKAYLLVPAGATGPAFLMLNNFRVIMKYNPAEAYALAIGHLADRLRGEMPLVTPWPRQERVLTSAERYELQAHLVRRGFNIGGEPDGRISTRSRSAIKSFQASLGAVPDGFATADLLERLRQQ